MVQSPSEAAAYPTPPMTSGSLEPAAWAWSSLRVPHRPTLRSHSPSSVSRARAARYCSQASVYRPTLAKASPRSPMLSSLVKSVRDRTSLAIWSSRPEAYRLVMDTLRSHSLSSGSSS